MIRHHHVPPPPEGLLRKIKDQNGKISPVPAINPSFKHTKFLRADLNKLFYPVRRSHALYGWGPARLQEVQQ